MGLSFSTPEIQQPMSQSREPQQAQQPPLVSGRLCHDKPLIATALATVSPAAQKQMIGERLYPQVARLQPDLADKIVSMMLEMETSKLLLLLETETELLTKVDEASRILQPPLPTPQTQFTEQPTPQAPQETQQLRLVSARPCHDKPLTFAALATVSPGGQKQMIGERLYPQVARLQPDLAGKIVGMMLEMDNRDLLMLLEAEAELLTKVDEILRILQVPFQKHGRKHLSVCNASLSSPVPVSSPRKYTKVADIKLDQTGLNLLVSLVSWARHPFIPGVYEIVVGDETGVVNFISDKQLCRLIPDSCLVSRNEERAIIGQRCRGGKGVSKGSNGGKGKWKGSGKGKYDGDDGEEHQWSDEDEHCTVNYFDSDTEEEEMKKMEVPLPLEICNAYVTQKMGFLQLRLQVDGTLSQASLEALHLGPTCYSGFCCTCTFVGNYCHYSGSFSNCKEECSISKGWFRGPYGGFCHDLYESSDSGRENLCRVHFQCLAEHDRESYICIDAPDKLGIGKYLYWSGQPLVVANSSNDMSAQRHEERIVKIRFKDLDGKEFEVDVSATIDGEELWSLVRCKWHLQTRDICKQAGEDVSLHVSDWTLGLHGQVLESFAQPLLALKGSEPVDIIVSRKIQYVSSVNQIKPDMDISSIDAVKIALVVVVVSISDCRTKMVVGDETGIVTMIFDMSQVAGMQNDMGNITVGQVLHVEDAYIKMQDGYIRLCVCNNSSVKKHFRNDVLLPNKSRDVSAIEYESVDVDSENSTPTNNVLILDWGMGRRRRGRFRY